MPQWDVLDGGTVNGRLRVAFRLWVKQHESLGRPPPEQHLVGGLTAGQGRIKETADMRESAGEARTRWLRRQDRKK